MECHLAPLQNLLKLDGKLITVGVPPHPLQLPTNALIFGRKSVAGSLIGGIKETQEMLDFCGEHNITSDVSLLELASPCCCTTPFVVFCLSPGLRLLAYITADHDVPSAGRGVPRELCERGVPADAQVGCALPLRHRCPGVHGAVEGLHQACLGEYMPDCPDLLRNVDHSCRWCVARLSV